jgi:hypothetical protein
MRHYDSVNIPTRLSTAATLLLVCAVLLLLEPFVIPSSTLETENVNTCRSISLARPAEGSPFTGIVHNASYGFDAALPAGMTGWGAAKGAPFHGFVIFLDAGLNSCINFNVQIHVELPENLPEPPTQANPGKPVKLDSETGTIRVWRGTVNGLEIENQEILVKRVRGQRQDDFVISFITPVADRKSTERVFESFLSELKFW